MAVVCGAGLSGVHLFVGSRTPATSPQLAPRRVDRAAAGADTFDPWTVLGISPTAGEAEARKAFKTLMRKWHPDVDPSKEAAFKFEQIVRANAVITGDDKNLDRATMLTNAVSNMRNDIEFKRVQIERLKQQAVDEEASMVQMQADMETAEVTRNKVTQELGIFGGAALGMLVGGPNGFLVGAVLGFAVKDRDDAAGQVVRGMGGLAKGLVTAVGNAIGKKE